MPSPSIAENPLRRLSLPVPGPEPHRLGRSHPRHSGHPYALTAGVGSAGAVLGAREAHVPSAKPLPALPGRRSIS